MGHQGGFKCTQSGKVVREGRYYIYLQCVFFCSGNFLMPGSAGE